MEGFSLTEWNMASYGSICSKEVFGNINWRTGMSKKYKGYGFVRVVIRLCCSLGSLLFVTIVCIMGIGAVQNAEEKSSSKRRMRQRLDIMILHKS